MRTGKININNEISGILTLPSDHEKFPTILFLHGFASDKNEINNIYQYMAEKLALKGVASLRIDFRGWGESSGKMEDSTIDKMIDDVVSSVEYLKKQPSFDIENISIIGFSLGAAVSILATEYIRCKSLILISPALHLINDFKIFIGEKNLSKLIEAESPFEINLPWKTIKMKKYFYLSLEKHDPIKFIKSFSGYLHCVAGKKDFSLANAKQIYKVANTKNKLLTDISNADHVFSRSDGTNILKEVADGIIANFLFI